MKSGHMSYTVILPTELVKRVKHLSVDMGIKQIDFYGKAIESYCDKLEAELEKE